MDKLLKKMDTLDPEERKRLRTLLQEKGDTKTEVQWMYKCDKPETEEYLLGRRIDKHIEEPQESEDTDKNTPGALFEEVIARRTDLDMHTKMREDPLYAIRRKEEEARKKLLQNPIKMKHLQKMIEEKEKHKASKKRKEKKKHKKHKKHKHRSSSSSSDSDDSLVRQYLEVVKKKQKMCAEASSRSEDEQGEVKKRQYGLIVAATQEAMPKKHRQESSLHRQETKSESVREERYKRHTKEVSGSRTLSPPHKSRSYRRSRSRDRQGSRYRHSEPHREDRKRKLDSDTIERKRQMMLENAKWRDEQRRENVKKYKEADQEKTVSTKHKHGADFLNPLLMEHAAQSSVADRIKRNIYSIQRTTADLDKSFTKR